MTPEQFLSKLGNCVIYCRTDDTRGNEHLATLIAPGKEYCLTESFQCSVSNALSKKSWRSTRYKNPNDSTLPMFWRIDQIDHIVLTQNE